MSDRALSPLARKMALGVALIAAVTLATRLYLRTEQSESIFAALSYMAQYFTILTNTLTLIMMLCIAFGRNLSARLIKAVVISIVCVGIIYHTLLAHLVTLTGIDLWADHGTHTFVPLLSGIWWIVFGVNPALRFQDVLLWVAWPIVYCIYILTRANISGFYPYPFLNVPEIGWSGVITGVGGLVIGFIVVGLVLTAIGHFRSRGEPPHGA